MRRFQDIIQSAVKAVSREAVQVRAVPVLAGECTDYVEWLGAILLPRVYDCVVVAAKGSDDKEAVMHYNRDVSPEFFRDFLRRGGALQAAMVVHTQAAVSDDMHPGVMRSRQALAQVMEALVGGAGLSRDQIYLTTVGSGDMLYLPGNEDDAPERRYGLSGSIKRVGGMRGPCYAVTEITPRAARLPLFSARKASGFKDERGDGEFMSPGAESSESPDGYFVKSCSAGSGGRKRGR